MSHGEDDRPRDDRRQRLIAALLLAFCIDTLRPAVATVAHQHAGSDQPHVHLGIVTATRAPHRSLLAGAGIVPRRSTTARRTAVATATPSELHVHLLRTLHLAHVAPPPPDLGVERGVPFPTPRQERPYCVASLPGHARAPPSALSA